MSMGAVGIVGAAQLYYGWKMQKLCDSLGSREAANAAWFDQAHPYAAGLAPQKKAPQRPKTSRGAANATVYLCLISTG